MSFYHYHTKNHSSQQLTVIVEENNMPSIENSISLEPQTKILRLQIFPNTFPVSSKQSARRKRIFRKGNKVTSSLMMVFH